MNTSKFRASPTQRLAGCALVLAIVAGHWRQAHAQTAAESFQAYSLRHVQAAQVESQIVRLLAGLPTPAEVIADPQNNRILVRGNDQAQQLVQQTLRALDKPMDAGGEAVLRSYGAAGNGDEQVRQLQAAFGNQAGVRVAYDARTSQILVLAPLEVHAQIAAQLGQPQAAQQVPPATAAPPMAQPTPAARAAAPAASPDAPRKVSLKHTTWEEVERSLAQLLPGRLKLAEGNPADAGIYVLTLAGQQQIHFRVHRGGREVEILGNGPLAKSGARLVEVLDAPSAVRNRRQAVLSIPPTHEQPVKKAVHALHAAQELSVTGPDGETKSIVRALPGSDARGPAADRPAVPLVAQLFQAGQAPAQAQAQPAQPGEIRAVPAPPGGIPGGLTSGLLGPVQVEIIEDLGIIIISGNERDVEKVAQIIQQIEALPAPTVEVFPLQHANSEAVAALIAGFYDQVLLPRLGRVNITALVKPNALLLIGREESVAAVRDLIQKLDQPVAPSTQFSVFPLKHATASTAAATITEFFAERTGLGPRVTVSSDFRTNSLIVQAAPGDMAEVAELIQRIDTAQSVATDILRVFPLQNSLAEELAPVLQEAINAQGAGARPGALAPGAAPAPPGAGAPSGRASALKFMTIDAQGQRELSSGILADVRITADPRANALIVAGPANSMDLVEALIRQLDQIPAAESQIKVFTIVNGDAQMMMTMLQALFGQQQQAGAAGGFFGAGAGAQGFQGENPLVSMRFAVDQRTNSIIASGTAKDLLIVEAILLRLDSEDVRQRQSIVYRLKNAPALAVAQTINDFLQSERQVQALAPEQISPFQQIEREVVVVPEQVSNSLIVSATPRYFEEIRQIVEELDARPPMVMIQVLIAEVTLNNTDEFGVELGLQDSLLFNRSLLGDLITTTRSTQTPQGNTVITTTDQVIQAATLTPGFNFNNQPLGNSGSDVALSTKDKVAGQALTNFSVGRVNGELGFGGLVLSASSDSVSLLIRALKECRRLEVLSRPQIMTLDNQPAFIQVGSRVPRIQGVTLGQFGQTNNVVDVNVGIILGVTPRISPDGLVVMEIDAERSALGPEAEGVPISTSTTGEVVRQPLINTTTAQTTVSAADGQTVVLGGLLTKDTAKTRRRVPLLSSIPIVGNLFRYDQDITRRRELLIIMTPRIVRNEADAELVKQAEAARMSWCLADVRKMHGDPGIYTRDGEWYEGQTVVIHPDQNPLGVEEVPAPGQSILPPGVMTTPDGRVIQGPALAPPPQAPQTPPPPPQPGPPQGVPPLNGAGRPLEPGPGQPGTTPTPAQQGPHLAPASVDQAMYGPPPWQGAPQGVQAVYYQPPAAR